MDEILKRLLDVAWQSSPVLVALVALGYAMKTVFVKRLEGLAGRVEEIKKTSLAIKKDMRGEERGVLVAYRVAVEKWEDYLLRLLFDFTVQGPSAVEVSTLASTEQTLFLEVRVAVVKACIYLQNEELERELRATILKIRNLYFPTIMESLPTLIDLQTQLEPITRKLKRFRDTGDPSCGPTEQDRQSSARLHAALTAETKRFADALVGQYRPIAEQLETLKTSMRDYIYRPIEHAEVDRD